MLTDRWGGLSWQAICRQDAQLRLQNSQAEPNHSWLLRRAPQDAAWLHPPAEPNRAEGDGWHWELGARLRVSSWDSGGYIILVWGQRGFIVGLMSKSLRMGQQQRAPSPHLMGQELAGHILPGEGREGIGSRGGGRCQVSGREAWAEGMRERVRGRGAIPALATNHQRWGRPPHGLF